MTKIRRITVLILIALSAGVLATASPAMAVDTHETFKMTTPSCTKLYYKGPATRPTQVQIWCEGRVIKVDGDYTETVKSEGVKNIDDITDGPITVRNIIIVNGEVRAFVADQFGNTTALIRNINNEDKPLESANQTRRY